MTEKLDQVRQKIALALSGAERPAVLWSSGKDSQLLLHLTREVAPNIPVVFFRDDNWADSSERLAWAMGEAERLQLTIYQWQPVRRMFIRGPSEIDLVSFYTVGSYESGNPGILSVFVLVNDDFRCLPTCGKVLTEETGPQVDVPFDVLLHGQRACDVHPTLGPALLLPDGSAVGPVELFYPLRDLTDQEVWEAIRELGVPYNVARYDEGKTRTSNDERDVCVRCLTGVGEVLCPLTMRMVPVVED